MASNMSDLETGIRMSMTSKSGNRYEGTLHSYEDNGQIMVFEDVIQFGKTDKMRRRPKFLGKNLKVNYKNDLEKLNIVEDDDDDDDTATDTSETSEESESDVTSSETDSDDDFSDYSSFYSEDSYLYEEEEVQVTKTSPVSSGRGSGQNSPFHAREEPDNCQGFDSFIQFLETKTPTPIPPDEGGAKATPSQDFPTIEESKNMNTKRPKVKTMKIKDLMQTKVLEIPLPYNQVAAKATNTPRFEEDEVKEVKLVNGKWVLPLVEKVTKKKKPKIEIPAEMDDVIKFQFNDFPGMTEIQKKVKDTLLNLAIDGLNKDNYKEFWTFLLYVEELEEQWQLEKHDLFNVKLVQKGSSKPVTLQVPGVVDKNPNVLKMDTVNIFIGNDYFGLTVEDVFFNTLVFAHNRTLITEHFKPKRGMGKANSDKTVKVFANVQFNVNESCLKTMHRSLSYLEKWMIVRLFPDKDKVFDPKGEKAHLEDLTLFNKMIKKNKEQSEFVLAVVNGLAHPHPHILFGPPGTGKTVTVVEAIKQLWARKPKAKILVTAPSNTAADLLAIRLHQDIPETDLLRWLAPSREDMPMDPAIENVIKTGKLAVKTVKQYRVVVSTLGNAGRVLSCGIESGHFTHLFVDEAGQATEPEVLIPMASVLDKGGEVVLSGDPHQLGPVVKSKLADKYGLGTSLMERLMATPLYSRDPATGKRNGRFVTKLLKNFRSHPQLLSLPSKLFYENELKPQISPNQSILLTHQSWIQAKGFPLVFHGVKHLHARSDKGTSLFNTLEVAKVMDYMSRLRHVVPQHEIGVVSPYKRQVRMIKEELKKAGLGDVLVGSTEEFQGQEREVMILSTVRSKYGYNVFHDLESRDEFTVNEATGEITTKELGLSLVDGLVPSKRAGHGGLGFLTNRKRFNVAVTRAKSLMIVIGDPHLLQENKYWRDLIKHAVVNGGYVGTELDHEIVTKWKSEAKEEKVKEEKVKKEKAKEVKVKEVKVKEVKVKEEQIKEENKGEQVKEEKVKEETAKEEKVEEEKAKEQKVKEEKAKEEKAGD